jgi:hypothetical protein
MWSIWSLLVVAAVEVVVVRLAVRVEACLLVFLA